MKSTGTGLLVFLFCSILSSCQADTELVKQPFLKYKQAILDNNGNAAMQYIDKRTFDYFSGLLEKIKNDDSTQLETETLTDKFTILRVRNRATRREILAMNEKDLFAYSFDHGFISKAYILNHSVGEITISQDSAKGIMLKENQKTPMVYSFYKENGKWKFCLAAVIGLHELAFKQLVTDSNLSDKDYILKFLESVSGRKAPKTIWNPVK